MEDMLRFWSRCLGGLFGNSEVSKGSSWRLLEVILGFSWLILALLRGPSGGHLGPEMDPRLDLIAQDGTKIALDGPRWPQASPSRPQDGRDCPRWPKMAPRWPEVALRSSHHLAAVHVASFRPPPAQVIHAGGGPRHRYRKSRPEKVI